MRQILQDLHGGATILAEGPAPTVEPGHVLIRTSRSLVSQGTEKMLVQFGRASLWQKARSQPDKVKQVLAKIRTDGLVPTVEAVFRKLREPLPLGYCNAGVVVGIGQDTGFGLAEAAHPAFRIGDRVVSNGPHAEFVSVPANLVAKVPDNVTDDAAAFTVIGAIGLQGIRLAEPELGETFVVIGLGLIGQMAAQLLKAHGCRVIGFDFDIAKVQLARSFGIEAIRSGGETDPVKSVLNRTGGMGCDGVIITASTSSNDVIRQSAQMSRKRGRIILVGVIGLELNRADFYEKELIFQVSCSYGPGRYEADYEEKGYDYPPAFVRWTENRNFQAVLHAMGSGSLRVDPLITKKVRLEDYRAIYDNIDGGGLASLLVYEETEDTPAATGLGVENGVAEKETSSFSSSSPAGARAGGTTIRVCDRQVGLGALAVVGAGLFTRMTAMPALEKAKAPVKIIVSSGGVTGTSLAQKHGVPFSSTDFAAVLADSDIRGVIITTRHNLHASQTIAALRADKHVLVEKPLCLTTEELRQIQQVVLPQAEAKGNPGYGNEVGSRGPAAKTVSIGFNRRFSPFVQQMKLLLGEAGPISLTATMNAGAVPASHWVHDPKVGGGRLVGEACHFVDLAIYLTGSMVSAVSASALADTSDSASILLRHQNGSTSVVNYLANGSREMSKERIEVHSDGRSLLLDNFRELRGFGFRSFNKMRTQQDKGHAAQFAIFAQRVKENGPPLIPWPEIVNVSRATLAIPQAIAERKWLEIES